MTLCKVWVVMNGSGGDLSGYQAGTPDPALASRDKATAERLGTGRGWYGGNADVRQYDAATGADGRLYLLAALEPVRLA